MDKNSEWTNVIMGRVVGGLLSIIVFGIEVWTMVKSKKLEDALDEQFTEESEDEEDEHSKKD